MAGKSKRSGNKTKSGGASAGKRAVRKGGAPMRDLEAKNAKGVRGGVVRKAGEKPLED